MYCLRRAGLRGKAPECRAGRVVYTPKEDLGQYFSVDVPAGQDGRLWRAKAYELNLLTVPPLVGLEAGGLLLPASLVEAEKKTKR